ncbi:hypothetical protein [Deinococcus humi]|uniref:Putative phosphodiesterase n=1 Tax=Deinococcus humi TaxID=662880 RepID=A0A7W8K2N6_9DEIO|nr:hypothetical protein [Deinococcus humi]MBB5366468.1 putative phosphodiesterase [Deinococcus humi]GGI66841.1 hypothetical protein GCM10008949_53760 [Deinococcus humi]
MTPVAEQIITVRGAWDGHVTDPERVFRGKIVHSDLAELRQGTTAEIRYGHSTTHAQNAAEHGTYTLTAGSIRVPLMSFTCRTVGTTGHHSTDDAQDADWQAVPLG